MTDVRLATRSDAEGCVEVLALLPDYFTPATHEEVRERIGAGLSWVAVDGTSILGFILIEARYRSTAEITFAAVSPQHRRSGVGSSLVAEAIEWLRASGVVAVEVKTLDSSMIYEPYVATRAFWESQGFVQIDCIDPLPGWSEGNPSAVYVACLAPTR